MKLKEEGISMNNTSDKMWKVFLDNFKNDKIGGKLNDSVSGSYENFYNDYYLDTDQNVILFYFLIKNNKNDIFHVNQNNSNILVKDKTNLTKPGIHYTKGNKKFMSLSDLKKKIENYNGKNIKIVFYGYDVFNVTKLQNFQVRLFITADLNNIDTIKKYLEKLLENQ